MATQFNVDALEINIMEVMGKEYSISPLLKLKGHIAYKAASLMKMAVLQEAKQLRESGNGVDGLNESLKAVLDKRADERWTEMSGQGEVQESLYHTACKLVGYHNELVFVLQDLVDPSGLQRHKTGFKFMGVPFREKDYHDSWKGIIQLHQESEKEKQGLTSYKDYCEIVPDGNFRLSEEEWKSTQKEEYKPFCEWGDEIMSLITNLGLDHTCEFDELPIRAQIGAIENMRKKLKTIVATTLKSINYKEGLNNEARAMEGTKMKGLILESKEEKTGKSLEETLCSMLERPSYKGFEEFMYGYSPEREATPLVQRFKPTPALAPEEDLEGVI